MRTAERLIRWKGTQELQEVIFGIGEYDESLDNEVFFWVEDENELLSLEQDDNGEDFKIVF